jgi:hypothetical protein
VDSAVHACDPSSIVDLDALAGLAGGVKEARFRGALQSSLPSELEPPAGCARPGGGGGYERVHRFTVPVGPTARLYASTVQDGTNPQLDTVIYLRSGCLDTGALACNDDAEAPGPRPLASTISLDLAGGTAVYVIVDGFDRYALGAYELDVRAGPIPADAGAP